MVAFTFDIKEAYEILKPLLFFLVGIVIYAVFIFNFYRFIARKDIFTLNLSQYNRSTHPFFEKLLSIIFYLLEYVLFFPLFVFFWFAVMTVLLAFISREPVVSNIVLISMVLVSAIRVTAYYNEDLSKDLAKMLPFALLAIFIVDVSFFSYEASVNVLKEIPDLLSTLLYYFIFVVCLEFVLRVFSAIVSSE